MKQFIQSGPDIPEEVIRAFQRDELVLFCGSGISMKNGLPNFEGLVQRVLEEFNITDNDLLNEMFSGHRYDKVLDLLEGDLDFSVPKKVLRKKIIQILNDFSAETPEIHKALLNLSRMSDGKGYRLVTTNFDRLFFEAGLEKNRFDAAPKLAPPRKGRWINLTFLHGLIEEESDFSGDDLVLTTTDFGLAYLYDNWAARFIIQLFRDFTILFVGYSVNDPIMQYLVSAINAERKSSSKKIFMYAFAGYIEGENNKKKCKEEKCHKCMCNKCKCRKKKYSKEELEQEWKGAGVTPIFYQMSDEKDHSLLHNTIKKYSESKSMGISEKKQHLRAQIKDPYKDDDKALATHVVSFLKTDEQMAKFFSSSELNSPESTDINSSEVNDVNPSNLADISPSKPVDISWIKPFSDKGLLKKLVQKKDGLWEPLLELELEFHIMLWLISYHLDKQELIDWVIEQFQGNIIELHPTFKQILDSKLNYESNKYNLHKRQKAFWDFLSNKSEKHLWSNDPYETIKNLNKSYSYDKARKLISQLEPQIIFNKTFTKRLKDINQSTEGINDLRSFYEAELKIRTGFYPKKLYNKETLLKHAENFSDLLKKAMELAEHFDIISEENSDLLYIFRPSIEDHDQNEDYYPWVYLVDLVRDSFDKAMEEQDKKLAKLLLEKWKMYPHSIFYRLILYAATKYPDADIEEAALGLIEQKTNQVLWSPSCRRELFTFLNKKKHLKEFIERITPLILEGPSRSLYVRKIKESHFEELKEWSIFRILKQLKKSNNKLNKDLEDLYSKIKSTYSWLKEDYNRTDERDSFPYYSTEAQIVGDEKKYHNKTNEEIFKNIINIKPDDKFSIERSVENFRGFSNDHPERAFEVLCKFKDSDLKVALFWSAFISAISFKNDSEEIFSKSFKKLYEFNDEFIKKCLWSLVHGFKMKGGILYIESKEYFNSWWQKLWNLALEDSSQKRGDPVDRSLNSHLGKLSHLIFYILWEILYKESFKRDEGIPKEIKDYFKIILKEGVEKDHSVLCHFGSYLYSLWFLDKEWVMKYIKSFMKTNDKNFEALWAGYLNHAKWKIDFFYEFKDQLFDLINADRFHKRDGWHNNYRSNISILFLMMSGGVAIDSIFNENESRTLIKKMDEDMLKEISRQLWTSLKDSEDKSEKLWAKIKSWIENNWPQQNNRNSTETAIYFSYMVVCSGEGNFKYAFDLLRSRIESFINRNNDYILSLLEKKNRLNYASDHPKDLLKLLIWSFPNQDTLWHLKDKIKTIHDKILEKHKHSLETEPELKELLNKLEQMCN